MWCLCLTTYQNEKYPALAQAISTLARTFDASFFLPIPSAALIRAALDRTSFFSGLKVCILCEVYLNIFIKLIII